MDRLRPLKYFSVISLPLLTALGFALKGIWVFLPLAEAFVLVPAFELLFRPDHRNLEDEQEQAFLKNPWFDYVLYLFVPLHFVVLIWFLFEMSIFNGYSWERLGMVFSMGLMCGVFGINLAHELGHRSERGEKVLAKSLLLTSLYMHFNIEHNRGHHKNVGTPEDPSSARKGEALYMFWFRSVFGTWISSWRIEAQRLKKLGGSVFSWRNEMLRMQIMQVLLLLAIWWVFGITALLYFVLAAVIGFLLLETVNYIEHYGLTRKMLESGRYERVLPAHSWNSDHILGRILLFELSRHSDHHFKASRKYQILRHHERSPQMPTGYPGMMILALFPPLWFSIMNPLIPSDN